MGKARRVKLGTRTFEKAGDAMAYFSTMLNKYSTGQRVSSADVADLNSLVNRHDEKIQKIGVGIDHFKVDTAPPSDGPPTRCFWIVRTDGTEIDFSFKHCLKATPDDM